MVARQVVRLGRRKAAWEKSDPREIAEVEFQDRSTGEFDLRPSVYVVTTEAPPSLRPLVVRVRAEHSASCLSPPRPSQSTLEFNADGATAAQLQPTKGETKFQFANSVHAELLLQSPDELLALIAKLLAERDKRAIAIQGAEVLAYVDDRLVANDPEWCAVVGPAGEWSTAIDGFRRRRAAARSR